MFKEKLNKLHPLTVALIGSLQVVALTLSHRQASSKNEASLPPLGMGPAPAWAPTVGSYVKICAHHPAIPPAVERTGPPTMAQEHVLLKSRIHTHVCIYIYICLY